MCIGLSNAMADDPYPTLRTFWPYYVSEHLSPLNRVLHAIGSLMALTWLGLAIGLQQPILLLPALVNGYAFAWVGHFFVEKNRPATFKYPFKSFVCDWLLLSMTITGRIGREIERLDAAGVLPKKRAPEPQSV